MAVEVEGEEEAEIAELVADRLHLLSPLDPVPPDHLGGGGLPLVLSVVRLLLETESVAILALHLYQGPHRDHGADHRSSSHRVRRGRKSGRLRLLLMKRNPLELLLEVIVANVG